MIHGAAPITDPIHEPDLAAKVSFLSQGEHLGEPGVEVERIETHFAWVFLTPQQVYKLRKPILHRSLDTRSLGARLARCNDELHVNRDLAPGIYLDVLRLALGPEGRMMLGGAGPAAGPSIAIVDWILHMRRLPAARMLDRMIGDGSVRTTDIEALSAHLQAFYSRSPALTISGAAHCQRLGAAIRTNRDELLAARFLGVDAAVVTEIASLQQKWVDVNRTILTRRVEQGMIRDCHGDLKPEHVCLGPPVSVIDRLEFDAELRMLDPIEDLCFLWLECARFGAGWAGEHLVRHYMAASGAAAPASLIHFYLSNRALTRAKVAVWRLTEPGADRMRWSGRVADYLRSALTAIAQAA
jgi:uncharacterized protein